MLTKLLFSNFYSFAEEQELSFEVGRKPSASYYDIDAPSGERVNKVAAVVGANGAGKTQFLRPLAFLSSFIIDSAFDLKPDEAIPFIPHQLFRDKPTSFELHFTLDEQEYKYIISLTRKCIISEALYKKTSRSFSYVFVRDLDDNGGYTFKQKGFGFSVTQGKKVRQNVSVISAAYQQNVSTANDIYEFFKKFVSNLTFRGRRHFHEAAIVEVAEYLRDNETLMDMVHQAIFDLDLGIDDIEYKEHTFNDESGKEITFPFPYAVHKCENGAFSLPLFEESSGTKALFVLLRRVAPVLQFGGIAVLDEIDNDLHPHMLPVILDWFKHKETNPNDAQLIFTCHTPEVLNILKKHQVYLVEKENLASEAWRLDEMVGIRADDNLYAKYQAGALGAVPNV
ncbi:abortive infection protein [Salinivibrio sp. VYel1]|nr:abortive infection protein [Salinivibrio sp. VYel1]